MNVNSEILLIEDDAQSVELTVRTLKKNHLVNNIQVVDNGVDALDYIFCQGTFATRDIRNLPALVLLDLVLPKVSGLEVLRRIRADERTQSIPVIMLSASREELDILVSHKLGANGYIVKPMDIEKFNLKFREIGLPWMLVR